MIQEEHKFLNPQPTPDGMDLYVVRSSILRALNQFIPVCEGVFLDVGCGQMPYKTMILGVNARITRYIGLDIENKGYQASVKPDLFWNGTEIPLPDNSVDCAMATEVLEHVFDPIPMLSEILRVLKPGGKFFATVPFLWPLHDVPYDQYRYTPFSLEKKIRDAGFDEICLKGLGGWDAALAQMLGLWIRRKPMPAEQRNQVTMMLQPLYDQLTKNIEEPSSFTEGQMITGISLTAQKPAATSVGKANARTTLSSSKPEPTRLAVFAPHIGALSETFIKRHMLNLSPGRTVVVSGTPVDTSWLSAPVLIIPYETPAGSRYDAATEKKVTAFLRRHHVTHILCEYGCHGTEIVELNARLLHLPIYVHFHGIDASQSLRNPQIVEYYRWMGERVDGIIVVSQPMKSRLAGLGIPADKIRVVHYGTDISAGLHQNDDDGVIRLLSVGRLVRKKAPLKLLEAVKKAHDIEPRIRLEIVGDGPLRNDVEKYIRAHGMADFVRCYGAKPFQYTAELYERADIYVQHSMVDPLTGDAEGLPNSIIEASAHGVPVVSTFHEGIPEAVKHGETGYLVEEGDTEGMARYIVELARNPELRKKLGAAARRKMYDEFSVDRQMSLLRSFIGLDDAGSIDASAGTAAEVDHREDYECLLESAETALQASDLVKAKQIIGIILSRNPKDVPALNDLAVAMILGLEWRNASDTIEMVLSIDPVNQVALANKKHLTEVLMKSGIANQTGIRPATELLNEAETALTSGDAARAREILVWILGERSDDVNALNDLAAAEIILKSWEKAGQIIAKVLQVDPENTVALNNLIVLKQSLTAELNRISSGGARQHVQANHVTSDARDENHLSVGRASDVRPGNATRAVTGESAIEKSPGDPKVSIIITTFNRPKFLFGCFESMTGQTFKDFEVIVVNDGGVDVSGVVAQFRNLKVKYLTHERSRGPAAGRNTAIRKAKGKYIAYLDDDDIYYPNHLQVLVNFLEKTGHRVAYTDAYRAHQVKVGDKYETTHYDLPYSHTFDREKLFRTNYMPLLTIMHERSILDSVGIFDEEFTTQQDWELWIRMSGVATFVHLPVVTCEFRWRPDGSSRTSSNAPDFGRTYRNCLIKHFSEMIQAQRILARRAELHGQIGESLRLMQDVRRLLPDNGEVAAEIARLQNIEEQSDTRQTSVPAAGSQQTNPYVAPAYFGLASGDYENAYKKFKAAISFDSSDVDALMGFGHTCLALGRVDEAAIAYGDVLKIDVENDAAVKSLEIVSMRSNNEDRGNITTNRQNQMSGDSSIYASAKISV